MQSSDSALKLQDMYHVEADAEVAPSSDASGAQRENPKSADAIAVMPHVLKLEMAFGKLPLPNKKQHANWLTHIFVHMEETWKVWATFVKSVFHHAKKVACFFGLNASVTSCRHFGSKMPSNWQVRRAPLNKCPRSG